MSNTEYTGKKLFRVNMYDDSISVGIIIDFDNENTAKAIKNTFDSHCSDYSAIKGTPSLEEQLEEFLPLLASNIMIKCVREEDYYDLYKEEFCHLDGSDGIKVDSYDCVYLYNDDTRTSMSVNPSDFYIADVENCTDPE